MPGGVLTMADTNGEFPTVIGADARFKGELSFEKGVRIDGSFDGHIKSKGTLHVAEGAKVAANIEAGNVKIEGECKGNLTVSEKLHLLATARMEGDLRATRLEIADGAIFIGNVAVGQAAAETPFRRPAGAESIGGMSSGSSEPRMASPQPVMAPKPRPQEIRVTANP
jgi:cytoskeletal protein CcmA (bactofilin family)